MSKNRRIEWAERMLKSLSKYCDLDKDEFVILAGAKYREKLVPALKYTIIPLQHLAIGKQTQWLTQRLRRLEWKQEH